MKAAKRTTGWAVLLFGAMILGFPVAAREQVKSDAFANLVAAYSPQPQEYPTGKEYAQPDTSVPFRWHFYHDGAIERFEDAKRLLHADAYNPLEDAQDVYVERHSPVKFAMTGEHVTQGKQALRVDFPARAIQTGKAGVWIKANSGPPSFSPYFKSLTCVWSYYRWFKCDACNPVDAPVRVRVAGVPLILHPGRNVVAVKTADASGHDRSGNIIPAVAIEVTDAHQDTILFFDHLRMEQEVPATFARVGKMFQFVGRYDDGKRKFGLPLCPGFTPIEAQTLYSPQ